MPLQVARVSKHLGTVHAFETRNFEGRVVSLHVIPKNTPRHKLLIANFARKFQFFGMQLDVIGKCLR